MLNHVSTIPKFGGTGLGIKESNQMCIDVFVPNLLCSIFPLFA